MLWTAVDVPRVHVARGVGEPGVVGIAYAVNPPDTLGKELAAETGDVLCAAGHGRSGGQSRAAETEARENWPFASMRRPCDITMPVHAPARWKLFRKSLCVPMTTCTSSRP